MKNLFLAFIASIVLAAPTVAVAQSVMDQREKELDLETETLQIHDLEAERKLAGEEAKRQEAEEKKLQRKLSEVKAKKEMTAERAKRDIAVYEARRIRAESEQKKYVTEIRKIQNENQKLESQMQAASAAAKRAEGLAEAGRSELAGAKAKREALWKAIRQKNLSTQKSKAEVERLRNDYQAVTNQNKRFDSTLKGSNTRLPASKK